MIGKIIRIIFIVLAFIFFFSARPQSPAEPGHPALNFVLLVAFVLIISSEGFLGRENKGKEGPKNEEKPSA